MNRYCCIVVIAVVLAVGIIAQNQLPNFSQEDIQKFALSNQKCTIETGIRPTDVLSIFGAQQQPKNPKVGRYLFCMTQGMGYQNADGSLNRDKIQKDVERLTPKQADAIMGSCIKQMSSPEDTAMNVARCVFNIVMPTVSG